MPGAPHIEFILIPEMKFIVIDRRLVAIDGSPGVPP
jgi:hypothetical protein